MKKIHEIRVRATNAFLGVYWYAKPRIKSRLLKIGALLAYWQDVLFWLPLVLVTMLTSWTWSQHLDPKAAPVDAGALQLLAFNILCLVIIFIMGWAAKKLYLGENAEEEYSATKQLSPLQRVILETIQWFGLFALCACVLLRGI